MNRFITLIKNRIKFINRIFSIFCGILLFILILIILFNIITRELGYPVQGITSIGITIMIVVIYLGLSGSEERDEHASVDMLSNILSHSWRKANNILIDFIKLFTIGIFFLISINEFIESYQRNETFADVVNIPLWPAKLGVSIGLFMFSTQILLKFLENFVKIE